MCVRSSLNTLAIRKLMSQRSFCAASKLPVMNISEAAGLDAIK